MTWVLITGATSGIGKETALRLAKAGVSVIATGRSEDKVAFLRAESAAAGLRLHVLQLDVDDAASVAAAAAAVDVLTSKYGVDVLVNNAGFALMSPVVVCSGERVERMFETNLIGAARTIRAFLPAMRARGRGRIINVSSVLGRMVTPLQGVYAATKHALEAMNDALRREVAPFGVEVVLLEPGAVDTGFNDVAFGPLGELVDDASWGPSVRRLRGIESLYRSTAAPAEVLAEALEFLCLGANPPPRSTVPALARAQLEAVRVSPRGAREGVLRMAMGLSGAPGSPAVPSRRALVTGAAGGIGRATCYQLAKSGYQVIATDVDRAGLAEMKARAAEQRLPVETRVMDVTDEASIARVALDVEVDLLVNNAGYAEIGPIELASDDAWRDQLAVNVFGLLSVTRAFAPAMMRRRFGRIINVSSVVGQVTFPFLGVYGASKHAIEALTDALRMELAGFGVDVVAVQPAFIRSGFAARAKASLERYDMESGPYGAATHRMEDILDRLDRLGGEPSDVARAIASAAKSASPDGRYQTPLSAWLAVRTVPWLPVRVADGAMARFMGIR